MMNASLVLKYSAFLAILAATIGFAAVRRSAITPLQHERDQLLTRRAELLTDFPATDELEQMRADNAEVHRLKLETRDLPRLRNEVRQLREQARELKALRAENRRLRSTPEAEATEIVSSTPGGAVMISEAEGLPVFPSIDQVQYAGYDSPEATLQTQIWALKEGDYDHFVRSWDPAVVEANLIPTREMLQEAGGKAIISQLGNLSIVARRVVSEDKIQLGLVATQNEPSGETTTKELIYTFKLVDGEWKLAEM